MAKPETLDAAIDAETSTSPLVAFVVNMPPLVAWVAATAPTSAAFAGMLGLFDKSLYEPLVATVASVGVPDKSLYAPVVATVDNVGLFKISPIPLDAFQSD